MLSPKAFLKKIERCFLEPKDVASLMSSSHTLHVVSYPNQGKSTFVIRPNLSLTDIVVTLGLNDYYGKHATHVNTTIERDIYTAQGLHWENQLTALGCASFKSLHLPLPLLCDAGDEVELKLSVQVEATEWGEGFALHASYRIPKTVARTLGWYELWEVSVIDPDERKHLEKFLTVASPEAQVYTYLKGHTAT